MEKKQKGLLRTGFTTGTCASAATKSALLTILTNKSQESVQVTLPKGKVVDMRIAWTQYRDEFVTCAVVKDGGDDPDATHGSEICSTVQLTDNIGKIDVDGGVGVGRVTKPGLGLKIGSAAINPVPKRMINQTIDEVFEIYSQVTK